MADISHLTDLKSTEAIAADETYPANRRKAFQLPPRGVYTLVAPSKFADDAFGSTKAGNLIITINPTVADGPHAGFTVRRTRVSAKPYLRKGETVSQLGDYLIATGFQGVISGDPQEQADAVESTAGLTFKADLDWVAENYSTGFKLEGMSKFPRNADGTYQSWVNDPTEKDPTTGEPKRLLANLYVRNYLAPATE